MKMITTTTEASRQLVLDVARGQLMHLDPSPHGAATMQFVKMQFVMSDIGVNVDAADFGGKNSTTGTAFDATALTEIACHGRRSCTTGTWAYASVFANKEHSQRKRMT